MGQQLKRWESPRREGRNDKGRGGAARKRQYKKQQQQLRKKLGDRPPTQNPQREERPLLFFLSYVFLSYVRRASLKCKSCQPDLLMVTP